MATASRRAWRHQKMEGYVAVDPKDLAECLECGAVVDRMAKHKKWHRDLTSRLDEIESYALDAQEKLGN